MIGRILGKRYEITEKIAQGGMSTVYKALDLNLNRYDAVKILKEEFAQNPEILERFKQEANAVAFLSHPNIVNIYNVGSEGNIHYIVMEYVKGQTLKEIIRSKGMLPNEEILNYSYQISRALESAHNSNIIHRDIKPHNIIITRDNLVKVTDFGIAKHSDSATITNSGKIIGSAHYFSPEQARGNMTDRRSDIYSLGIVMYEMATGTVPFDAESPITIALMHMQEPLPSPKLKNPQLSDGLERIILRATAKNPIDRYQRIEDMMMDLRTLMAGERLVGEVNPNNGSTQIMGAVVPESKKMKNDIYDDERPSSSKKRGLIIGLAMILVVVVGALIGNAVFKGMNNNNPPIVAEDEVAVPNLVGKTQEQAEAELKALGLELEVTSTETSDKPEGEVLRTVPEANTKVKKGASVGVVLSGGLEKLLVPDVTGSTKEAAEITLMNNGFILGGVSDEYNDTIPAGEVIRQDPMVNTSMPKGSPISIVISKGPEVTLSAVPGLIGKTEREAQALLESRNLVLDPVINKVPTGDEALNGRVSAQNIPEGTEIKQGSSVIITVYEYKTVQIPFNLVGKKASEVMALINAANLKGVYIAGTESSDIVVEVSPSSGTLVPYGSTVEILGEPEQIGPQTPANP
ncbi:Stk1 family PASTA domain-containing Ser/Thr kinase [Proteiniclasticum sp. BAD-10]|uniref:non-specific serine/threonine protein kinase n=1 Tax=Proteiniclasticum sediminis TaxID=2804028 RepID=A0A941HPK7_9CLOT|nr:Stk1 family PASTA domain-containing Ser/Thr kinase [Proteiniclasticum sediminis]MBR0575444.1 Stk1 family PASTA domain-containing Ser/Thr kinase [Proteiniclasticum sediminis]